MLHLLLGDDGGAPLGRGLGGRLGRREDVTFGFAGREQERVAEYEDGVGADAEGELERDHTEDGEVGEAEATVDGRPHGERRREQDEGEKGEERRAQDGGGEAEE